MGAPMAEISFVAKPAVGAAETTWRLTGESLKWGTGGAWRELGLGEVVFLRLFGSPGLAAPFLGGAKVAQGFDLCELRTASGETLRFNSNHFVSLGNFEDRTATFRPFVTALARGVAGSNPAARLVWGMPPLVWGLWVFVLVGVGLIALFALAIVGAGLEHGALGDVGVGALFLASAGYGVAGLWRTVAGGRTRAFDPRAG
jgi:hypothetical protein